jgi:hypothetical protein
VLRCWRPRRQALQLPRPRLVLRAWHPRPPPAAWAAVLGGRGDESGRRCFCTGRRFPAGLVHCQVPPSVRLKHRDRTAGSPCDTGTRASHVRAANTRARLLHRILMGTSKCGAEPRIAAGFQISQPFCVRSWEFACDATEMLLRTRWSQRAVAGCPFGATNATRVTRQECAAPRGAVLPVKVRP